MALRFNLQHLDENDLELAGELAVEELEFPTGDSLVQARKPLAYDLVIQKLEQSVLVQGRLEIWLDCVCVRCLKPFPFQLVLPDWSLLLALTGDDAVPVNNDIVDLTPLVREDMLLSFPQHPLCETECGGLPQMDKKKTNRSGESDPGSPAWTVLDQLKLKQ
jgi:uncharacterized protein